MYPSVFYLSSQNFNSTKFLPVSTYFSQQVTSTRGPYEKRYRFEILRNERKGTKVCLYCQR